MNRKHATWIGAAAVALLVLGSLAVASVQAADDGMKKDAQTLVGQLNRDAQGGYQLLEEESGDWIALKGPVNFAEHTGEKVEVTGKWIKDADGKAHFMVTELEVAGS